MINIRGLHCPSPLNVTFRWLCRFPIPVCSDSLAKGLSGELIEIFSLSKWVAMTTMRKWDQNCQSYSIRWITASTGLWLRWKRRICLSQWLLGKSFRLPIIMWFQLDLASTCFNCPQLCYWKAWEYKLLTALSVAIFNNSRKFKSFKIGSRIFAYVIVIINIMYPSIWHDSTYCMLIYEWNVYLRKTMYSRSVWFRTSRSWSLIQTSLGPWPRTAILVRITHGRETMSLLVEVSTVAKSTMNFRDLCFREESRM